jgi:hypothetical protein
MTVYISNGIKYSEVWFNELPDPNVDVVVRRQFNEPLSNAKCRAFPTLLIDLSKTEIDLYLDIKQNTRYEIRRSEAKDNCIAEYFFKKDNILLDFYNYYEIFAQHNRLQKLDWNKLNKMYLNDRIVISCINCQGETLVWHAYYCVHGRARLLYSASIFDGLTSAQRNLIGRANRYLHWKDILKFKNLNYHSYDFGGWSPLGDLDIKKQKINKFKEEFGGVKIVNYDCIYPDSRVGKIFLKIKRFIGREF